MAFRDVKNLPDYGKELAWPKPPAVLNDFVETVKKIHKAWRARFIVAQIPPFLKESFNEKVAAFEVFNKERKSWGIMRSWKGDYLEQVSEFFFLKRFVAVS